MSQLFANTQRFQAALSIVNDVDVNRMGRVLMRVLSRLHLRSQNAFSDEECSRLEEVLDLTSTELHTMVNVVGYVFEQAAYRAVPADRLASELEAAGMSAEAAERFSIVWQELGGTYLHHLRSQPLSGTPSLTGVKYDTHINIASDAVAPFPPSESLSALLEFQLSTKEKLQVEYNHNQLYELLCSFDDIQKSLDSLN